MSQAAPLSPPHPLADAIRVLAMDAVQQANSGHPGAPMGMAEMAVALWHDHLKHNPEDPTWPDRDRFVLSNGHASMLLYALLHLTGYALPIDEIRRFRQLGSQTPGHPEVGITPGVETTTGPLGQGLSNAVGMALAEKLLARDFNRPDHTVIDHRTYVFLGDGCLMEGISHEACALAAAWKLEKLVALYDDNGISIDGQVAPWFPEDTIQRFQSYGWNVIGPVDGQDPAAVSAAIAQSHHSQGRPTLIVARTTIGYGSPNRAGTAKAHGEPLGTAEIALVRERLQWTAPPFEIPDHIRSAWDARTRGAAAQSAWRARFEAYRAAHPELAAELERRLAGQHEQRLQTAVSSALAEARQQAATVATRKASQLALEKLTAELPELLGGSADLTGSNLTQTTSTPALRMAPGTGAANDGRHINYGVREFGMAGILNGLALHGGFIPYAGTFLTFSDYSRNAIRMAALMRQRVIHVFTHDSIGLGEDGPTHQSVEHAASLRLIPCLDVWRPADTEETVVAWAESIANRTRPSALLLSRQNLPFLGVLPEAQPQRGAYVLKDPPPSRKKPALQAVIMATGSEVHLALQAQAALADRGRRVRVVSVPSTTVFDRQSREYQLSVLPPNVPRVAVEAGVTSGWWRYGCAAVIGIDSYGESAPGPTLFEHFHITADNIVATVEHLLTQA